MALIGVHAAAQALLDLVVTTAAEEGVVLPGRRYVTAGAGGREAWDCPQVTVGITALSPRPAATPGEHVGPTLTTSGRPGLPTATLQAEIVRPHPVMTDDGEPPSVEAEQAAGVVSLRDVALLHRVRTKAMTHAPLTGGGPAQIALGPIIPMGPEGGLSSQRLTLAVTLL